MATHPQSDLQSVKQIDAKELIPETVAIDPDQISPKGKFGQSLADQARRKRLVEELRKPGITKTQAMLNAGFSATTAANAKRSISRTTLALIAKTHDKYEIIGKIFNPEQRANIVRGALLQNVADGKDKAVRSLELLGKDSDVGIFRNDNNQVSVQIAIPIGLQALFGAPVENSQKSSFIDETPVVHGEFENKVDAMNIDSKHD